MAVRLRLLILLCEGPYNEVMKKSQKRPGRPDIDAAVRGGDWTQGMDGEGPPARATLKQALYWTNIYSEILTMEEKVLGRIEKLMAAQSAQARREVELTNVPVVTAQAERFRQRLGYWQARVFELDGGTSNREPTGLAKSRIQNPVAITAAPEAVASSRRRATPNTRPRP